MIDTMRTYFCAAGHDPVTPSRFAAAILQSTKDHVRRQMGTVGIVPASVLEVLAVELGDPATPSGRPIAAYINASRWLVKCECGGVEFADWDEPVFMCCSCWNRADQHAFRPVTLPAARDHIEAVLAHRPDPETRGWLPHETPADLAAENVARGIPIPVGIVPTATREREEVV